MRHALFLVVTLLATPALAQHAGTRQQWQPQTEQDPRLQQPVQAELICISTARGLPLLAEQAGVAFSVAPESLDTVGERKFTVLARGCAVKEIMVQLCEALRECHWDVDTSGEEPVYLLHRNSGVEAWERERRAREFGEKMARRRETRTAEVEAIRQALQMTPDELASPGNRDLLLSRAVRYPPMRSAMEAFLLLPQQQLDDFIEMGGVGLHYSELPEEAQRLVLYAMQEQLVARIRRLSSGSRDSELRAKMEAFANALSTRLSEATLLVSDGYGGHGIHISWWIKGVGDAQMTVTPDGQVHYPESVELLTGTGDTEERAKQLLEDVDARWQEAYREAQGGPRPGPLAPEMEQKIRMPWQGPLSLTDIEKAVAAGTGLSVVADAFWCDLGGGWFDRITFYPARRTLVGAAASAELEWWTTGRLLVLRRSEESWADRVRRDVPESVVLRYREKLQAQGRFTLDDAAALVWEMRAVLNASRQGSLELPEDLADLGLGGLLRYGLQWAPALLPNLAPDQRARAETAAGLRLGELGQRQRDAALVLAGERFRQGIGDPEAVFRIAVSEGKEKGRGYTRYGLSLESTQAPEEEPSGWIRLWDAKDEAGRAMERPEHARPADSPR